MTTDIDRSFIFIGNIIKFIGIEEHGEIFNDCILKKANEPQIDYIKEQILKMGNPYNFMFWYESKSEPIKNGGFTSISLNDKKDWNFWIIEHNQQSSGNLKLALSLSQSDLNPLFERVYNGNFPAGSGTGFQYQKYFNYIDANLLGNERVKEISITDIQEIKETFNIVEWFQSEALDKYPYVKKSLDDFRQLKMIPWKSPFFIVGMFSIMESLLSRNPNKDNTSITHQLKTKLSLLNNRFDERIDIHQFFQDGKFDSIISKLYDYRSDIAHGDFSDFNKDLQIIGNMDKASDFLYSLLQKVLVQSLKEPQLITDLKYC